RGEQRASRQWNYRNLLQRRQGLHLREWLVRNNAAGLGFDSDQRSCGVISVAQDFRKSYFRLTQLQIVRLGGFGLFLFGSQNDQRGQGIFLLHGWGLLLPHRHADNKNSRCTGSCEQKSGESW